jgi:hypothetical protein
LLEENITIKGGMVALGEYCPEDEEIIIPSLRK